MNKLKIVEKDIHWRLVSFVENVKRIVNLLNSKKLVINVEKTHFMIFQQASTKQDKTDKIKIELLKYSF